MPDEVSCTGCGARLSVPEGAHAPWLDCPHCRARLVNPHAFRLNIPPRLTWTGAVGTLLILLGTIGWFFGCGAIVLVKFDASLGELYVHTLACVFLIGAGLMVLRAGFDRVRRPFLVVASVLALLAVVALLVASGLVFVFATCLTKI